MPCSFVHLSLEERRQLARLREQKIAVDEIARVLGRHRSMIYRELKRNWWHDAEVPQAEGYWPVTVQQLADDRVCPLQAPASSRAPGRGCRAAQGRLVA